MPWGGLAHAGNLRPVDAQAARSQAADSLSLPLGGRKKSSARPGIGASHSRYAPDEGLPRAGRRSNKCAQGGGKA